MEALLFVSWFWIAAYTSGKRLSGTLSSFLASRSLCVAGVARASRALARNSVCFSAFSAILNGVARSVLVSAVAHCVIFVLSLLMNLAVSMVEEDGVGAKSSNSANRMTGWAERDENVVSRSSTSLSQVRDAIGRLM